MRGQIQAAQAIRLRDTSSPAVGRVCSHVAHIRGHAMQTFNFTPFYRSTVGFDRLFTTLDQRVGIDGAAQSYPPYHNERTGENAYGISVAVAGFTDADLSIEAKENMLTIRGQKQMNDEETSELLYRGIAGR